jgi:CrcB protein
MEKILMAGLGGALGSILRFLGNSLIYRLFNYSMFPYGVFFINILGCLIIGFLGGLDQLREIFNPSWRVFIFVGVLGGFTTFSSFGWDSFNLFRNGMALPALLNIFLQVLLGLGCVWLGYTAAHWLPIK